MPPSTPRTEAPLSDLGDDRTGPISCDLYEDAAIGFLRSAAAQGDLETSAPQRRFERLTLALLVLTLCCIGVLVLLVIADKQITDRNSEISERALDLTAELTKFDYDLKIMDLSERAFARYANSDSVTRYHISVGQLGDRLAVLAGLTDQVASERETMRVLARSLARHMRETAPAIAMERTDRAEAARLLARTIDGNENIGRVAGVAATLRDDVKTRRAGLLAQTLRFDHYSTIALITVLICTSISFGALTYSVKKWLQDRDETVRLLHEAKLVAERASSAKTNFLALMSHELRTPLNAILGFAEVIRDRVLGPGKDDIYSNYAADIHSSGAHLLQLINKLLDVVQNGEGKTTLRLEPVDVSQIAQDCLKMVRAQAEKGGVALKSHIPVKVPDLRADGLRLTEIVLNLLSNAVKFTPPGGSVTLTIDARHDALMIRVEDNGTGIPAARMPTLFEPFGHVADPLSGARRGSGLGLSIAKHLTELHGGELTITSQTGRGTVAVVMLPLPTGGERNLEQADPDTVLQTAARV